MSEETVKTQRELEDELLGVAPASDTSQTKTQDPTQGTSETPVAPVTESATIPSAEDPELARIRAENEQLRVQLNDFAKTFGRPADPATTPSTTVQPTSGMPAATPDTIQFITEDEADKLIDDPTNTLNTVLNRVYQAGRESALKEVPDIATNIASRQISVAKLRDDFWTANSDLMEYKDFVGLVASQVEVENPNWNLKQIFDETGVRTRARLNLPNVATQDGKVKPKDDVPLDPALPSGDRTSRKPQLDAAQKLDPEQKEKDDFDSYFGLTPK